MSNLFSGKNISINDDNQLILFKDKRVYSLSKRIIDLLGASLGIVILLLLFVIIGILIKVEDPNGKIIFKQKRVGKDGKEFYIYKFRSMVSDAEKRLDNLLKYNEVDGAMFKMKEDPRVTKVGKLIRKTSIDELPQLFNVFKGNMSLVGPRPPLPREVAEYSHYQKQRLLVTPGCTGLWQIAGRSNLGFREMVELDLQYIAKRNIILDLKIIFKTLGVFFGSKGAF